MVLYSHWRYITNFAAPTLTMTMKIEMTKEAFEQVQSIVAKAKTLNNTNKVSNTPWIPTVFLVCDSRKRSAKALAAFTEIIDANNYAMAVKGTVRMGFYHLGDTVESSFFQTF